MTDYVETISDYYIQQGKKEGEIKTTLSIIDNLIEKAGTDWSFIANTTGVNEDQYCQMKHEYQQLSACQSFVWSSESWLKWLYIKECVENIILISLEHTKE